MKNADHWLPGKFEFRHRAGAAIGVLRGLCGLCGLCGLRDARELGLGSRLISGPVAGLYPRRLASRARALGRLLDLGCGKVPLDAAYAGLVSELTGVDRTPGEHIDLPCDLSQPLLGFQRSGLDARVARVSSRHFPLGYFLIAEKPERPAAAEPLAGAAAA